MKSDTFERVYVDVKAAFNASGRLMPLEIKWIDGQVFEIDKVTDVRQAAAMKAAGMLSLLTGWPVIDQGEKNCFVGAGFEIMKKPGRGQNGHIAIACNSAERAKWHLESRGFAFDAGSEEFTKDGRLRLVYMKDEIAGFALHLVEK